MNIDELRSKVEKYREALKSKTGAAVAFSVTGPANTGLIDALVAVVEAQDRRIKDLEDRLQK